MRTTSLVLAVAGVLVTRSLAEAQCVEHKRASDGYCRGGKWLKDRYPNKKWPLTFQAAEIQKLTKNDIPDIQAAIAHCQQTIDGVQRLKNGNARFVYDSVMSGFPPSKVELERVLGEVKRRSEEKARSEKKKEESPEEDFDIPEPEPAPDPMAAEAEEKKRKEGEMEKKKELLKDIPESAEAKEKPEKFVIDAQLKSPE